MSYNCKKTEKIFDKNHLYPYDTVFFMICIVNKGNFYKFQTNQVFKSTDIKIKHAQKLKDALNFSELHEIKNNNPVLKFGGLSLSEFPSDVLKHDKNLTEIILDSNYITDISPAFKFKGISLFCSKNKIKKSLSLPQESKLKYIDVSLNEITSIDLQSNYLNALVAPFNKINDIKINETNKTLEKLFVASNNLFELYIKNTFIKFLDISKNNFDHIPALPKTIYSLNISSNKISGNVNLTKCKTLKYVNMCSNIIAKVNLQKNINELSISSNKINYLCLNNTKHVYASSCVDLEEIIIRGYTKYLNINYSDKVKKITFKDWEDDYNFNIDYSHVKSFIVTPFKVHKSIDNDDIKLESAAYCIQNAFRSYKEKTKLKSKGVSDGHYCIVL